MIKKIFVYIFSSIIISVLVEGIIIFGLIFSVMTNQYKKEITEKTNNIVEQLTKSNLSEHETINFFNNYTKFNNDIRITYLDTNGKVLYDSKADVRIMENHLSRSEIVQAMKNGIGSAQRYSNTISEKTYYYAMKLSTNIIRLSFSRNSIWIFILTVIQPFLLIIFLLMLISVYLAKKLAKNLIKPILGIDLSNPDCIDDYEELDPLIHKIAIQNNVIKEKIYELEKQQKEFIAITSNMKEGFVLINSKMNVVSINNSALDLFEVEKEIVVGKLIFDFYRNIEFERLVKSAIEGNDCEIEIQQKKKWFSFSCTSVKSFDKLIGCVILIRNITERREAENIRREFTANVSHELKTPLTSISGYAQIINSDFIDKQDIPEFAQRIYNESIRMLTLITDIINLSQLDELSEEKKNKLLSDKSKISLDDDIDLKELANKIIYHLSKQAEDKKIKIDIKGNSEVIKGNEIIIQEMIYNLCDNAIKYNVQNGKIDISINKKENKVIFSIHDTGIGIAKDEQEKIFERFYRVDKSRSRQTGGTGLGLSIVKHAAQIHNAEIRLNSKLGKGTKIECIFNNA